MSKQDIPWNIPWNVQAGCSYLVSQLLIQQVHPRQVESLSTTSSISCFSHFSCCSLITFVSVAAPTVSTCDHTHVVQSTKVVHHHSSPVPRKISHFHNAHMHTHLM